MPPLFPSFLGVIPMSLKLTNKYQRLPLSSITVLRDERQRRDLAIDEGFRESIRRRGVLQPIIVSKESDGRIVLVAGERRYTASTELGLPDIPVRFVEELSTTEAQIIELEENLRRADLSWRDFVRAVGNLHKLYKDSEPGWTQEKTATHLALAAPTMTQILRVWKDLDNPRIAQATSYGSAYNVLQRLDERQFSKVMSDMMEMVPEAGEQEEGEEEEDFGVDDLEDDTPTQEGGAPSPRPSPTPPRPVPRPPVPRPAPAPEPIILNQSFLEWAPAYSGKRFNFVHCDFPYGINFNAGKQGDRNAQAGYDDSPDVYWDLCKCLCENAERLFLPSAHFMFWFSMEYYSETLKFFAENFPLLELQRHPLFWMKTDNIGVLPDPQRGPRRVVETALIGSLGDRKIVKPVANGHGSPTDKRFHQSTKPEPMLKHFFTMFVDEHTVMLDPTCGSGSALRAADAMRAESVLGLEINKEHADNALVAFNQARSLRKASEK